MTTRHDSNAWEQTATGLLLPRRRVLRGGLAAFAAAVMARTLPACGSGDAGSPGDAGAASDAGGGDVDAGTVVFPVRTVPSPPVISSRIAAIGPLQAADANGVRLPAGFTARIVARGEQMVPGSSYEWHLAPDGGATFITEDSGFIYVSNSELPLIGGVGALRFSASGELRDAYRILDRTHANCAGGKTPWHTWLSCEEIARGVVYECDPWGETAAVARPALGVFKHEAVAVDPVRGHLYLTEDESNGRLYRFTPSGSHPGGALNLSAGVLEVAEVVGGDEGSITWHELPDPQFTAGVATRSQVAASTAFRGGEGIWYHAGIVYFSTKGDNRIWKYDVDGNELTILYDDDSHAPDAPLVGVDNITVSCCGDVLVAEDGGSMQIVAILPDGELKPLVQIEGHDESEITGPAFDPSGTRLYFSSQRGEGTGVTYEVTGPFHEPA